MGGFDWSSTNKAACPDFHAANVRAKCRSNDRLSLASIRRDACFQRLSGQTSMASTIRIWRTSIHLSITMPRSFFDWHARRRRPTHMLFLFQGFAFFFGTGEDGEPVHVHVAKGHPSAHATKTWLARNGGCLLASNGSKLTKRELADVMDFVMANHADICQRWCDYFHGDISFYK